MKKLALLLHKEWRDQRLSCLVAFAACTLVLAGATFFGIWRSSVETRSRTLIPICLGSFVLLLATESIGRDAQNGVGRTLSLMPVPQRLAWFAKYLFVALAGLGFLLALTLVDSVLRAIDGRPSMGAWLDMVQPDRWAVVATVAAAGFASACVLRRSLPSAIVGLGAVAVLPYLARHPFNIWLDIPLSAWSGSELACLGCMAFVTASWFAFRVRRPDPIGLRRGALFVVIVACFAVVPLGWSASRVWPTLEIPLFDPAARIAQVYPSPDGRFLAIDAWRVFDLEHEWAQCEDPKELRAFRGREEVWVLDRQTGHWNDLDSRWRTLTPLFVFGSGPISPWDRQNRLAARSASGPFGWLDLQRELIDFSDPSTPRVSWTMPESRAAQEALEKEMHFERTYAKAITHEHEVLPSAERGIVFVIEDHSLVRRDLGTLESRVLCAIEGREPIVSASPDERWIWFIDKNSRAILDARDGHLIFELGTEGALVCWSRIPGRIAIVKKGTKDDTGGKDRRGVLLLYVDGSTRPLPTSPQMCREMDAEHMLVFDEQRIESLNLDTGAKEQLYPPAH